VRVVAARAVAARAGKILTGIFVPAWLDQFTVSAGCGKLLGSMLAAS
jgi:hypothetical protein